MNGEPALSVTDDGGRLLERDRELAVLHDALARAEKGTGTLVLIEGPAGVGKSRLVDATVQAARGRGMRCFLGRGAELERATAFGVTRQLLVPAWMELDARARAKHLEGLAEGGAAVLGSEGPAGDAVRADQASLVDALYWLVYGMVHAAPGDAVPPATLVAVDDAQWSDTATLRLLARLVVGLEGLSLAIVVAVRSDELDPPVPLLRLRGDPAAVCLAPKPLTDAAVAVVVREGLGAHAASELCRQCAAATGGNPFLLRELVASLRADGVAPSAEAAAAVASMVPESVVRSVLLRLARLPSTSGTLAQAAAILGPDAPLCRGAALARLETAASEAAADALVSAGILRSADPLVFSHPLIASAVAADMPARARAQLHRRAAELLRADGAPVERVAAHLRATSPAGDAWVVSTLRGAAVGALASGNALEAVQLLERALAEPPPAEEESPLLFELAQAEAANGSPKALERLAQLGGLVADRRRRAVALQAMARLLFARGEVRAAVEAAEKGRAELDPDDPLAMRILASQLAIMFFVPGAWPQTEAHLQTLEAMLEAGRLPDDPLLLAQLATRRGVWLGEGPARVRPLAEASLAATSDAKEVWQGDASMAAALVYVGEADLAERVLARMSAYAQRSGSPIHAGMAAHWRAVLRLQQGWVADAAIDAQRVLDTHDLGWSFETTWCAGVLAQARVELGDVPGARRAIDLGRGAGPVHLPYGFLLHASGEVAMAEGDFEAALRDFLESGEHCDRFSLSNPAVVPWRSGAVAALALLGQRRRAADMAGVDVAHARATGTAHGLGGALRAAAMANEGQDRLDLLCEAVHVLAPSSGQLEHVRALCDLGTALRRARQSPAARDTLERALQLARQLGATATAQRAYRELRLAGARPSRRQEGTAALTPGERRVAELAAADLSNAEIAKRLFLTARTVEWHLTQSYRKLGIRSRAGLADALQRQRADGAHAPPMARHQLSS